jgi:hypothetical protein
MLDPTSPILIHNQFDGLRIEESDDNAEDVPDIDLPRVASEIPNTSFEPQMERVEAVSAIVMFLGDLYDTKSYLGTLWIDYEAGLVDLITAAVTTNTALDILQKPHDELMKRVMPLFEDNFELMVFYTFLILRGPDGGHVTGIPGFDLIDESDRKLEQIYDLLMLPLVQILEGLAESLTAGKIPYPQIGAYGKYDPNAPFGELRSQARWKQYRILLPELLSDVEFLLDHSGGVEISESALGIDSIIRLLDRFIHTKEISFHLTFAMRVFMDINFALGAAASRGRKYLHDTAGRMIGCLNSRPSLGGPILANTWDIENEKIVDLFMAQATGCANLDLRQNKILPELNFTDWLLIDRHPLLCGLLVFRLQIAYQDIGLALANEWGSIQYAAHLYEACRHSGHTPRDGQLPKWPDMELVLELHGKELAFGGKLPTTLDESERAFQRVAGFSTDVIKATLGAFTGDVPQHRDVKKSKLWSHAGPLYLRDQTQILPIYKRNLLENSGTDVQHDMIAIEALLRDLKAGEDKSSARTSKPKFKGRGYRKEKKHHAAKFSMNQLLSVLERGLQSETTSIRFDYVSMHVQCLNIFRDIKTVCQPTLLAKLGFDCTENDHILPNITGWILTFAALGHREIGKEARFKPIQGRLRSALILGCSGVFRKALANDSGRKETIKVEEDRKS